MRDRGSGARECLVGEPERGVGKHQGLTYRIQSQPGIIPDGVGHASGGEERVGPVSEQQLVDDPAQENSEWVDPGRADDPDEGERRRREIPRPEQFEQGPGSDERRDVRGRDHDCHHRADQDGADVDELGPCQPDQERGEERESEEAQDGRMHAARAVDVDEHDDPGDRGHRNDGSDEPEQDPTFAWRSDLEPPPAAGDQRQADEVGHGALIHADPVPVRGPTRSTLTDR